MLQIHNLKKAYNGVVVVDIPELEIREGETVGLVGNNGAGKTTLFRMLLDLVRPDQGEVLIKNEKVAHNNHWKYFTGSYLDESFLLDFLTADEYFKFIANLYSISEAEMDARLHRFEEMFNDEIRIKKKYLRDLSKGNQKKAGIAAAILPNPDLLILDEPFANLDPSTQIRLKKLLRDLVQEKNMTMFISSHDLNHVTEVCERILVLEKGRLVKDIQTNPQTLAELEAYFAV